MTSGFPGDFFYGGGGGGVRPAIGGTQGGVFPYGFRQPQQQQQQQGVYMADQIGNQHRRSDFLIGKRSFSDFQSQQISVFQQQQQYLMRSVKQRNNSGFGLSSSPSMDIQSARFGLPVYRSQQQQAFSLLAQNNNQFGYSISGSNLTQVTNPEFGFLNSVQAKPDPEESHGIMNSLLELEKELLNDDEDENQPDGDGVSGITNSEWSETFQNLISPDPSPSPTQSPNPNPVSATTSGNNLMISPSPTSSSCSTSASPPATLPAVTVKQLISDAATAISDGKIEASTDILNRLAQSSNAKGNSEQRLGFYMCHALRSRVDSRAHAPPVMELFGEEHLSAMFSLYDLSPCFKFVHFAANLVMLEAIASSFKEGLNVHVIEFDIGNGSQYMNLLRALSERRSSTGSSVVKITVVETEIGHGATVDTVKDGLVSLAEKVGINLKFERVSRKINELTCNSLGCEDGEAILVNFAFKLYRVPDESVSMENLRDELLRRVKGLNPSAVTLVEQDLNANTASFTTRVNGAFEYYSALFDSIDSCSSPTADRVRVEEALGRKMANSIACEGRERVERPEVFGKWRARMGMAGFALKPVGQGVVESMRAKLNSGFTVKEESGGVGFGWMGRSLTVASAWR